MRNAPEQVAKPIENFLATLVSPFRHLQICGRWLSIWLRYPQPV